MHTRNRPDQWIAQPPLQPEQILPGILDGLNASLAMAASAEIPSASIVLDPGYGFGKRLGENLSLLRRQSDLLSLGYPLLVGLSRKSFLTHALDQSGISASPQSREHAGIAALTAAILAGASIVRVHSPEPARAAAAIADAILTSA
jgi:dihydropteroate synthase